MRAATFVLLLGAACRPIAAFLPSPSAASVLDRVVVGRLRAERADDDAGGDGIASLPTRRCFAEELLKGSIAIASLVPLASSPAYASGGATAGGAYLLSAKQRYNKRVTAGIKAFLTLDERDLSQVNAFFDSTEEGGWEDLSAAGYLLANAFRTSSTKAPDSLPAVKKWKAFAKDIELLKRALARR
ncbi:hypothetical protein ACHAXT_010426 [Thalassiosira profunda]